MKILHVIKRLDYGGAENYTCALCNSLAGNGNDVFIMARKGRLNCRLDDRITFITARLRDLFFPYHLFRMVRLIRRHGIEVIHAHQRFPIFIATVAGVITGVKVVATVHGVIHIDLRSVFVKKHLSGVICVNMFTHRKALRIKSLVGKTFFVPNAISVYSEPRDRVPSQICYISRIDRRHSTLIRMIINEVIPKMISTVPDIKFVIAGDGLYLKYVKADAERLNKEMGREVCIAKGYLSNTASLIREARIVLGVGRVALDALANATPLLSINFKRMGELVSTENFEFYDLNNYVAVQRPGPTPKKIIKELTRFFSDADHWQRETELLTAKLHEIHNPATITRQIEEIYRG